MDNTSKKKMYTRTVAVFFVVLVAAFVCIVRVLKISTDTKYSQAASKQSSVSVELYNIRGDIYDTNMVPLTNVGDSEATIFLPTPSGVTALVDLIPSDEQVYPLSRLYSKKPVLIECVGGGAEGTVSVNIPQRYISGGFAAHLLGYLNNERHGVSGIEKGCDDLLYTGNSAVLRYSVSATGDPLGVEPEIDLNNDNVSSIILTVDSRIQQIAENQLKRIESGGIIITEKGGEIRAMASAPCFDPNNPSASLDSPNSPFLNRTLTNYSVGSVFKVLTAAAALDAGFSTGTRYECTGKTVINGVTLTCHQNSGHGVVDMQTAIAQSCNCYFYDLALAVGADRIYDAIEKCGFAGEQDIGGGLIIPMGKLPEKQKLIGSDAALANLAIGQGELLLSPASVTVLYQSILNSGTAVSPKIIQGKMSPVGYNELSGDSRSVQIMSQYAADTIKKFLINALSEGTGAAAYSEGITSGGKTATAQTGQRIDGREKNNGWFCGFFEKGDKVYNVVIMSEDCDMQNVSCAEIFKEICEQVAELS